MRRAIYTLAALALMCSAVCAQDPSSIQGVTNVNPTDCSGTIATGGTAQNLFPAGTVLHGFTLMNLDTTNGLWMSLTGTAAASTQGSYFLQPATATVAGGSFTSPLGFGTNRAVSIVGAGTGQKFSCTRW